MRKIDQDVLSRRSFLQTSALAGGALAASSLLTPGRATAAEKKGLKSKVVIVFQGDSITDAGRDRNGGAANNAQGLGRGYPSLIGGALLAEYPEKQLTVYNRGISGNKVPDLAARWQADAIDLKPDVLSILIGVNDLWHKLSGKYNGTVADYEKGYRELLEQTLEKLPGVRLVICEPFVLRCGAVNDTWFPEFEQRRAVANKLAEELKLDRVPFQSMFDEAVKLAGPEYWAGDGVHPTLAGHALMAKTWREVVGI
ncbi:MAG: SGNH/GDSL hydrolase family protein [Thermoguttaceae bacterium]